MRPFVPPITWGIVVAIAVYPAYRKLESLLGGRRALAAVLCTVFLLAALIVPTALLAGTLVEGIQTLITRLKDFRIPPPPPSVMAWPLIGTSLNRVWSLASTSLNDLLSSFAPQIKALITWLLAASAGIAFTELQFLLSILVSGVLLANVEGGSKMTLSLANRLFGEKGPELHKVIVTTIRSVAAGILGVAFIQSVLAGLGFLVMKLPGAGLWTTLFFVAAVLQVAPIVLIPAVIYAFATASTGKAVVFLIWCVVVGLLDNVLKPLLLGRGAAVPVVVVFLGVIGGFVLMGIIGLFVGAIVLSVGYKLFIAWLDEPVPQARAELDS
jgi:predicted PurR-regulated permease PerM